jgi:hypothetical protein
LKTLFSNRILNMKNEIFLTKNKHAHLTFYFFPNPSKSLKGLLNIDLCFSNLICLNNENSSSRFLNVFISLKTTLFQRTQFFSGIKRSCVKVKNS